MIYKLIIILNKIKKDGNIDQIKKQVAFDDKKSQDALNQSKLDLSDNKSINTKIEEDKTKALKMLDYYKNSLKKNLSASDSLSNSKVKIVNQTLVFGHLNFECCLPIGSRFLIDLI